MAKAQFELPTLHPSQLEVVRAAARFKVLACGRRWGKTRLGSALCIHTALSGGRAWWVAPSYPMSIVGWRLIHRLGIQVPRASIKLSDRSIFLPMTGGEIKVRSADNPDSLRGEGLDFVVMDECAFMKGAAWSESIRPALADKRGSAMFISTPKGINWFYELWLRCQDPDQSDWMGWQLPTSDNPFIHPDEIEAARRSLPDRVFQQEFLAQFIDDAGGVFRGVYDAAILDPLPGPTKDGFYVAGVDVADKLDWTVIIVMDARTREVVHMDRFQRVSYPVLEDRIYAAWEGWGLEALIIEDNSIGQGVIDHLRQRGVTILPWTTTSASKQVLVQNLASSFEHKRIKILSDPILTRELIAYQGERMPGGLFRYAAPDGMHDDTVIALGLADMACERFAPMDDDDPMDNFLFSN